MVDLCFAFYASHSVKNLEDRDRLVSDGMVVSHSLAAQPCRTALPHSLAAARRVRSLSPATPARIAVMVSSGLLFGVQITKNSGNDQTIAAPGAHASVCLGAHTSGCIYRERTLQRASTGNAHFSVHLICRLKSALPVGAHTLVYMSMPTEADAPCCWERTLQCAFSFAD